MIKKITMEDYLKELQEKEDKMDESTYVATLFARTAISLKKITKDKIVIRTDYDADGITSAYIMAKTLEDIYPNKEVEVRVNDRRGSYAALPDEKDDSVCYIIMDMGTNALDTVEEKYGDDCFIIDHHLANDNVTKQRFLAESRDNKRWLNLHLECGETAPDYCTAGLAYRLFLELDDGTNDKLRNTVAAMAAIGTVADCVNLMDENGLNRLIVKEGMNAINNATKSNFDEQVGYLLSTICPHIDGMEGVNVSASDIRMSIAPFINAAGRMSNAWGTNGSQVMYDLLCKDNNLAYRSLQALAALKKEVTKKVQNDETYVSFLKECKGKTGVQVFFVPDIDHGFCGLIASKICEATDLPCLCLTKNPKTGDYSGSGRNMGGYPSLKAFLDKAFEGRSVDIEYGGHDDAIGISHLSKKSISGFMRAITEANKTHQPNPKDLVLLDLTTEDLKTRKDEIMKFLNSIDPTAESCLIELPYETIRAAEKAQIASWATVSLITSKTVKGVEKEVKTNITDWGYYDSKYDDKHSALVSLGISNYNVGKVGKNGKKVEPSLDLCCVYRRSYEEERRDKKADVNRSKGDEPEI